MTESGFLSDLSGVLLRFLPLVGMLVGAVVSSIGSIGENTRVGQGQSTFRSNFAISMAVGGFSTVVSQLTFDLTQNPARTSAIGIYATSLTVMVVALVISIKMNSWDRKGLQTFALIGAVGLTAVFSFLSVLASAPVKHGGPDLRTSESNEQASSHEAEIPK